jgi:hypothetical protein
MKKYTFVLLWLTAASPVVAQDPGKPLFADRTWLCLGRGFVALVPIGFPQSLTVIRVGAKGVEAPQTVSKPGGEVHGLQCMGSHIELLFEDGDHFSVLPFNVQQGDIHQERREDLDWSISRKLAMPSVIERRIDAFNGIGSEAGAGIRGDWYLQVNFADGPGHLYEVHFIQSVKPDNLQLEVTLLDETLSRKVVKSVLLIRRKVSFKGD